MEYDSNGAITARRNANQSEIRRNVEKLHESPHLEKRLVREHIQPYGQPLEMIPLV